LLLLLLLHGFSDRVRHGMPPWHNRLLLLLPWYMVYSDNMVQWSLLRVHQGTGRLHHARSLLLLLLWVFYRTGRLQCMWPLQMLLLLLLCQSPRHLHQVWPLLLLKLLLLVHSGPRRRPHI
jgi:hypothetical protein